MTIFGQEKDKSTAGLAKMNLVLHQQNTGDIKTNSTLSSPQYKDGYGQLQKFDFIVMNPPFSDKSVMSIGFLDMESGVFLDKVSMEFLDTSSGLWLWPAFRPGFG